MGSPGSCLTECCVGLWAFSVIGDERPFQRLSARMNLTGNGRSSRLAMFPSLIFISEGGKGLLVALAATAHESWTS